MNLRETDPKVNSTGILKTLKYEDESPKKSEIQDNFVELADHFRSPGETNDFDEQLKKNIESDISNIIPPYIKMLDFHWIKAMLFFRKYYDFTQFFLQHGIFFPATAGGKIPCLTIERD